MAPNPKASPLSLIDQLEFYGSYHSHPANVVIHVATVPLLVATIACWLWYSGPLAGPAEGVPIPFLPQAGPLLVSNAAATVLALYGGYYVVLEPFAGVTWIFLQGLPCYLAAGYAYRAIPYAWAWSLALHVASWVVQVGLGHVVFERRKPALVDSLFQSFALAPLFVHLEVLFALGYRRSLAKELEGRVAANLKAFRGAGGGGGGSRPRTRSQKSRE